MVSISLNLHHRQKYLLSLTLENDVLGFEPGVLDAEQ